MSESVPKAPATRRLPENPKLEQLRKQAKELREQYCAGDPKTTAEVQQFERNPSPDSFALHDAQRVLARSYGYPSWPKLKAFVDGVNVRELAEAVKAGDAGRVRTFLHARPELIGMDIAASDEHRALHFAVLGRDAAMAKLLMEAGADARRGIYPHRDATTAIALARDRGYHEITAVIEEEERLRREELSCPNATISPLQDEINTAISGGDNTRAIRLLETDGSLIQACDREGASPLHIAAEEGNMAIAEWLLQRRASVRKEDLRGWTALDRAALAADPRNESAESFPAMAKLLLKHGAELTIYGAVALGDSGRVRELVSGDPGLLRRIRPTGGLLTLAVNHGQLEMAQFLLDLGADVDERILFEELEEPTPSWGMPLWYAALGNRFDLAKLLLDRGADPNANVYASGWPLRNAWGHEDGAVKKLLLERGAKPQPYMVAEAHDVEAAKRLLETDGGEWLAQELSWSAADHGCPAILEFALPRLEWAGNDSRWHWIIIQPIRGAGADDAAIGDHLRCLEVLLQHGVDANVSRYGQTALHFAAGYTGVVSGRSRARFAAMLLDYGARLDIRDDLLKSTPLAWACRWGRTELAQILIERGAPVHEPEAEAWAQPEAWAEKMGHPTITALLRTYQE